MDTSRCTWSLDTCPLMISTSFVRQISRINSLVRLAISPLNTFFRYFVTHTKWICRLYFAWDDVLYSLIPPFYLKTSLEGQGFIPRERQ